VTVVEEFELMLGGLFFLAFNGHHLFLQGLAESFHFVPIAKTSIQFVTLRDLSMIAQEIISFGIKLSAPVMGAILITNVAMGIVGRAVPQINVLVMSWPVNIMLGLMILFVSLPLFMLMLKENLNWNAETLFMLLKHL
jgi:flagellar biosynthetic protein FliR